MMRVYNKVYYLTLKGAIMKNSIDCELDVQPREQLEKAVASELQTEDKPIKELLNESSDESGDTGESGTNSEQ